MRFFLPNGKGFVAKAHLFLGPHQELMFDPTVAEWKVDKIRQGLQNQMPSGPG